MLTRDVRFEGFTATDWTRLLSLFSTEKPVVQDGGGVVAVHEDGRLRKLLHTRVGRLDLEGEPWPQSVADLATRHRAGWALAFEVGALEEVMERFGARAEPAQDILMQTIVLSQIAKELVAEGKIAWFPHKVRAIPTSAHGMFQSSLNGICPIGRVAAVGIFQDGELFTSIALRRRASGFDLVLGPDDVRRSLGLLSGDFRRDYRHLARAIEGLAGPLSFGLFTDVRTLQKLARLESRGAWARAVAVRDIVLSPLPAGVAVPLGIDATRGLFAAAKTFAERYDMSGAVAPTLEAIAKLRSSDGGAESDDPHPGLLAVLRRLLFRG